MSAIPLYDDSDGVPTPHTREDVRLTDISVRPYGDGRRVKLNFKLTPFLERPSVDITVTNAAGAEVASMSVIEAMDTEFDFTLHLRGSEPRGDHTLHLTLFYAASDAPDAHRQVVHESDLKFFIAAPS